MDFDIQEFLADHAPHLSAYAEVISHWCGYYSVSPKVLLTLIDIQSGLVSWGNTLESLDRPLGGLVESAEFAAQIKEALAALYSDFYAYLHKKDRQGETQFEDTVNAATYALMNLFRGDMRQEDYSFTVDSTRGDFIDTYEQLFPRDSEIGETGTGNVGTDAIPPIDFLQLPWMIGLSWHFNGVHTATGSTTGIMSSIDFAENWKSWGDDTSTDFVVAAHGGTATVYSSCFVRITASNGWSTNYYHLDNLTVSSGDALAPNQIIGVYANTLSQALCDGGGSTGPHVHFSLLENGVYSSLSGVDLSGYVVHPGRWSYDNDPAYMWVERSGTKYYVFSDTLDNDASSLPPAATLVSPHGTITDTTPTYTWSAVSGATSYKLVVKDASGFSISTWYTAATAGCSGGTGTCSVTPATAVNGASRWWIKTWNASGDGPWSSGMSFTVGTHPGKGTLVSPSGTITDTTPT
ncbi:MAG: M23 family metallopeptidase, partial [Gammaproteobacteria bacterium]|nr:M23 family metallopeptidase [Gammaproteobacteria bacterium]